MRLLSAVLLLCLLGAWSVPASAQTFIYVDYTNGHTVLVGGTVNITIPGTGGVGEAIDTTYDTAVTSSFKFGLDWHNDMDFITFTLPGSFALNADPGQPAGCNANAQVNLTASLRQCNYTVSWSAPFDGELAITYDNMGTGELPFSTVIAVLFNYSTAIRGDPQFVGLRGQEFQVHGIDGAVYNIISDKALQVNSRFVFLAEGECPILDGVADDNCWSHPGSYMKEMSFQELVDGVLHAAFISAGPAKKGFAVVEVDGKAVQVGETVKQGTFSLSFLTTHSLRIHTAQFSFLLTNSDLFVNQVITPKVSLSRLQAHGLLGQTHARRTYPTAIRHIEGEVDDYAITDNDIYGTDFVYNRFQQ